MEISGQWNPQVLTLVCHYLLQSVFCFGILFKAPSVCSTPAAKNSTQQPVIYVVFLNSSTVKQSVE